MAGKTVWHNYLQFLLVILFVHISIVTLVKYIVAASANRAKRELYGKVETKHAVTSEKEISVLCV